MPSQTKSQSKTGRYLSAAIGVVGGIVGITADLFTDEVRELILSDWLRVTVRMIVILLIFVGACLSTWFLSERLNLRKSQRQAIEDLTMEIRSDDLDDDLPNDHAVIGRELHYLERKTSSQYLTIFLPGLGLDARDFRRHMRTAEEHTIAITLFGFNVEEAHSDRYRPISLQTHTALIRSALEHFKQKYPTKSLILAGFSVGADLVLKLSENWQAHPDKALPLKGVLLLDPNIDQSTMNISTAVAAMDTSNPLAELRRLVQQTTNLTEFQNICEYLRKITDKNLDQVKQHASDVIEYCSDERSPEQFLRRVEILSSQTSSLRVVFSFDYERQFNSMLASARSKGLPKGIFTVTQLNHFQLMEDELLPVEFRRLTASAKRESQDRSTA